MDSVQASDIDFLERYDAFSIMPALSLEACRFAEHGQGPRLALDGEICPTGRIPVATSGGLKARDHPVGATGYNRSQKLFRSRAKRREKTRFRMPGLG